MKTSITLLTGALLLALHTTTAEAKPSTRILRTGANNLEEVRRSTYSIKEPKLLTFADSFMGVQLTYPDTWTSSFRKSSSGASAFFYDTKYGRSEIRLTMDIIDHAMTTQELEERYERLAKLPENDFELRTNPFIQNYRLLESSSDPWKTYPTSSHTFQYERMSKIKYQKLMLIAVGNKMYGVAYTAKPEDFEREMHNLTELLDSLKISDSIPVPSPSSLTGRSRVRNRLSVSGKSASERALERRQARMGR